MKYSVRISIDDSVCDISGSVSEGDDDTMIVNDLGHAIHSALRQAVHPNCDTLPNVWEYLIEALGLCLPDIVPGEFASDEDMLIEIAASVSEDREEQSPVSPLLKRACEIIRAQ
jgi:hypothetical protein